VKTWWKGGEDLARDFFIRHGATGFSELLSNQLYGLDMGSHAEFGLQLIIQELLSK
jgi:hypothetical protein